MHGSGVCPSRGRLHDAAPLPPADPIGSGGRWARARLVAPYEIPIWCGILIESCHNLRPGSSHDRCGLPSLDTVTLHQALFNQVLAKNDVRAEILQDFMRIVRSELVRAEFDYHGTAEMIVTRPARGSRTPNASTAKKTTLGRSLWERASLPLPRPAHRDVSGDPGSTRTPVDRPYFGSVEPCRS